MKKIINIAVVYLFILNVNAQQSRVKAKPIKQSWNSDNKLISIGIGFFVVEPFYFNKKIELSTTSTLTNIYSQPAQYMKAEIALASNIGIAICVNRSVTNFDDSYFDDYNKMIQTINVTEKVLTINLRANYHFINNKVFDPYIGIGLGLRKITYEALNYKVALYEARAPIGFEATLGIRGLLLPRISVYLECGISRSLIQSGITINLGKIKQNNISKNNIQQHENQN